MPVLHTYSNDISLSTFAWSSFITITFIKTTNGMKHNQLHKLALCLPYTNGGLMLSPSWLENTILSLIQRYLHMGTVKYQLVMVPVRSPSLHWWGVQAILNAHALSHNMLSLTDTGNM